MSRADSRPDPDDLFADTRMSFGDHLEDLRVHLWRALAGFGVAMVFSLLIAKPVLYNIIIRPVEIQLQEFYAELADRRAKEVIGDLGKYKDEEATKPRVVEFELSRKQIEAILKGQAIEPVENPEKLPDEEWIRLQARLPEPVKFSNAMLQAQRLLAPPATMKTFNITEAFMVWFKIGILSGLVLGSPWIFWQIWLFVAAGLYPHEKRYVHVYLPFSLALFLTGVLVCQFVVLPKVISALLWFNHWLNLEPDLRLNEWLGFAIIFPIIFGLSFQTPLVMLFLERLGIFDVDSYRKKRKIAFFILAVVSAIGPTIDAYSMMIQIAALWSLYELGIWLCIWFPRRQELDVPEPEEMVEV
jgi:sec-independent protein translocase protein TatC